jgi:hypothetical protein
VDQCPDRDQYSDEHANEYGCPDSDAYRHGDPLPHRNSHPDANEYRRRNCHANGEHDT